MPIPYWVPTHCEITWRPTDDTCFQPTVAVLEALAKSDDQRDAFGKQQKVKLCLYVCRKHAQWAAKAIARSPRGILTYYTELEE